MKILNILNDGPSELSTKMIEGQSGQGDVKTVDLTKGDLSYGELVEEIFSNDRVMSW